MRQSRISLLVIAFLLSLTVRLTAAVLSPNGKPYNEIVISSDAQEFVKLAAKELATYLKRTSESDIPIVTTFSGKFPAIFVGKSEYTEKAGIGVDGLNPEGYRIVSDKEKLVILGRDYDGSSLAIAVHPWRSTEIWSPELKLCLFGEQGTLNGVYAFLKEIAGVRWYVPGDDGEVIQPVATLKVPAYTKIDAPVFSQRYIYYSLNGVHTPDMLFMRRNGQGGPAPFYSNHNFRIMLKYKETNPEYFAIVDGKRDFTDLCNLGGGGNLCLSNPEVVKAFAKEACDYFKKYPGQRVFPVFPNDGMVRICGCDECQSQIDLKAPETGKFSRYYWKFACKVANEVAKTYPDHILACPGYESYRMPPDNIDRLPDNIAVQMVYKRDLDAVPATRKAVFDSLNGWASRAKHLYTWVHYLKNNDEWHGLPIGYPELFYNEFQELKAMKVWRGEMIEAEGKNDFAMNNPGMAHWKIYLTMMSHWNPDYDLKAVMEEYYHLFYGPAEGNMRQFWETAFNRFKTVADSCTGELIPEDVYTVEILERMNQLLIAAMQDVPKDSVYARRIGMIDAEFQEGRKSLLGFLQNGKREMEVPSIKTLDELDSMTMKRFVGRFGAPCTPITWMVAAHDDKDLILRFYCYEDDMSIVKRDAKDPDSVWSDDFVEFFLCTNPQDTAYAVQFAINPNGKVWDARYGVGLYSPSWDSTSIRTEAKMEANRWSLTVRLSLEEIGYQNLKAGDQIKANFYRGRHATPAPEYSCWSPVFEGRNFYPSRFGTLVWK